jgi:hypothetical protein
MPYKLQFFIMPLKEMAEFAALKWRQIIGVAKGCRLATRFSIGGLPRGESCSDITAVFQGLMKII